MKLRGLAGMGVLAGVVLALTAPVQGRAEPGQRVTGGPRCPAAAPQDAACAPLPWPSDRFSVADRRSPTRIRLRVPDTLTTAAVLAPLHPTMRPNALFGGATGFSPNGPILFEVPARPDPATFAAGVRVVDRDTGEAVPVLVETDTKALESAVPAHIVRIWPKVRFSFGHRLVAALTPALHALGSTTPYPGQPLLIDDAAAAALAARGVAPVAATAFTVRTAADVRAPLQRRVDAAYGAAHPVVISGALPFGGDIGTVVWGSVRLSDFRRPDGVLDAAPHDVWAEFYLTVPKASAVRPAPVVVYMHGILASKETMLPQFAFQNARAGVATIAIDQPNHGAREGIDGGSVPQLARSAANLHRLAALVAESPIDTASVVKAVETSLAGLDVVPYRFDPTRPGFAGGDGRPDLDPTRISFEGTSMGGVLGAAALGTVPKLRGAMLQVPGVGIINTLTSSAIWDAIGFDGMFPPGSTGRDRTLAMALAQHALDVGDGASFADLHPERSLVVTYGTDDGIVPNASTARLAALAKLPATDAAALPATPAARGVYAVPRSPGVAPEAWILLGHLTFTDARSEAVDWAYLTHVVNPQV